MQNPNFQNPENFIRSHSIPCTPRYRGYLNDLPGLFVLYIETNYHAQIHQYLRHHLKQIEQIYDQQDITFIYLPQTFSQNQDIFVYGHPGSRPDPNITPENITSVITDRLLIELDLPQPPEGAMLLTRTFDGENAKIILTALPEEVPTEQFFQTHADFYQPHYPAGHDGRHYCTTSMIPFSWNNDEDPDCRYDDEINTIISEIDERITRLKDKGLYHLLADTIAPMLTPRPSRLCITEELRIFLPDYQDMEIPLHPLSKAIYFLFLKHPEGIFLKNLPLYRPELTQIYRLISPRESLDKMNESIRKLTDPLDNSFYEKCSRVKRAFLNRFSDDWAEYYYISGRFQNPKQITLDRRFVEMPNVLKNILPAKSPDDSE